MPVFKDISGWREELNELSTGPAYKAMFPHGSRDPNDDPLLPLSAVLDYVETLLANAETREAILDLYKWHDAHPLKDGEYNDIGNDPTFPHDLSRLLSDFALWFKLKTGFGPRGYPYVLGPALAIKILKGEIPEVRCDEAVQFMKDHSRMHLDFNR